MVAAGPANAGSRKQELRVKSTYGLYTSSRWGLVVYSHAPAERGTGQQQIQGRLLKPWQSLWGSAVTRISQQCQLLLWSGKDSASPRQNLPGMEFCRERTVFSLTEPRPP